MTPPRAADALLVTLRRWLREERFRPGEMIGTERALAERLGQGRTVLRQALDVLEQEGQVRRGIGRAGGIFASNGKIQRHLNTTLGVPQMVRQQGMAVSTTVLRAELAPAAPDEVRQLQLPPDQPVLHVVRLRHVDGAPWSLDASTLPARRFPGLLQLDLTGSLYELLATRYAVEIDRAEERLEVVAADEAQADALQVAPGAALLHIRRTAYDLDGVAVEDAQDLFRADRTLVHMQKLGANWKRAPRDTQR